MTIEELKKKIDGAVKEGSMEPDDRIEIMDQLEVVSDQAQSLSERIASLPKIEEEDL